jgi:hypothetical protein
MMFKLHSYCSYAGPASMGVSCTTHLPLQVSVTNAFGFLVVSLTALPSPQASKPALAISEIHIETTVCL